MYNVYRRNSLDTVGFALNVGVQMVLDCWSRARGFVVEGEFLIESLLANLLEEYLGPKKGESASY